MKPRVFTAPFTLCEQPQNTSPFCLLTGPFKRHAPRSVVAHSLLGIYTWSASSVLANAVKITITAADMCNIPINYCTVYFSWEHVQV